MSQDPNDKAAMYDLDRELVTRLIMSRIEFDSLNPASFDTNQERKYTELMSEAQRLTAISATFGALVVLVLSALLNLFTLNYVGFAITTLITLLVVGVIKFTNSHEIDISSNLYSKLLSKIDKDKPESLIADFECRIRGVYNYASVLKAHVLTLPTQEAEAWTKVIFNSREGEPIRDLSTYYNMLSFIYLTIRSEDTSKERKDVDKFWSKV